MNILIFLVLFPMVVGIALFLTKSDNARNLIVRVAAAAIAAASIIFVVMYFGKGEAVFEFHNEAIGYVMLGIEIVFGVLIFCLGIKYKKYLVCLLVILQTPLLVWFEQTKAHGIEVTDNLFIDRLSMIMILIIGIIGTLICVFALGYMKDFQAHHKEDKDRRPWFFLLLFVFLSAMFGIVISNNLLWLYFFWEHTTLCSFFLIGFTKTGEAINNSFRALIFNLLGGLSFVLGIVALGTMYETLELSTMLSIGMMGYSVVLPTILLAFAGLTKAAQMPFSSWLLGAMVAPTPTSALLHSSTMVKAGVFLIIKLSPVLGIGNFAGWMVMGVGGVTFLMASFAAISQSNAKRVLAYSTVANLGLIVACGGVGTSAAVWAGIMIIIFHAITKSMLFLSVGTAEHNIGSRDIEDMDGLFDRMPKLAGLMMLGIAGMFLAPFGMLVSKWATMVSFVETQNILLVLLICFGSAATAFYWTKWLGKLSGIVAKGENVEKKVHKDEWFVLITHGVLVVAACLTFPVISITMIVPYLSGIFGKEATIALSSGNMAIMVVMIVAIILLFAFMFGKTSKKIVPIYMAGVNKGDNLTFEGAMQKEQALSLRNWYMDSYFGERKMNLIGNFVSAFAIVIPLILAVASVMAVLGGAS
ncbi:MAG: NADH-quinone oxidoreductase subunit 5 family protein [Anaerovoracaceae bacterium]